MLEDSIMDPLNQTMNTFTWHINCAGSVVIEEQYVYCANSDKSGWPKFDWEAWVSSSLFDIPRAVQEFGLAQFKKM